MFDNLASIEEAEDARQRVWLTAFIFFKRQEKDTLITSVE